MPILERTPTQQESDAVAAAINKYKDKKQSDPLNLTTPYTEAYKETCFQVWYAAGRPSSRQAVKIIPADEHNRKPTYVLLSTWIRLLGWNDRAKEMDHEVTKQMETYAVEQRVDMLKRHAESAKQLQLEGIKYLLEHPPEKTADAIRMVTEGIRIEKESVGLPEALTKIAEMKDKPLTELIGQLINRLTPNEIKQLETGNITVETNDIQEGEFTDEEDDA